MLRPPPSRAAPREFRRCQILSVACPIRHPCIRRSVACRKKWRVSLGPSMTGHAGPLRSAHCSPLVEHDRCTCRARARPTALVQDARRLGEVLLCWRAAHREIVWKTLEIRLRAGSSFGHSRSRKHVTRLVHA